MVISNAYILAKLRVSAFTMEEFSINYYILHQTSERSQIISLSSYNFILEALFYAASY